MGSKNGPVGWNGLNRAEAVAHLATFVMSKWLNFLVALLGAQVAKWKNILMKNRVRTVQVGMQ